MCNEHEGNNLPLPEGNFRGAVIETLTPDFLKLSDGREFKRQIQAHYRGPADKIDGSEYGTWVEQ